MNPTGPGLLLYVAILWLLAGCAQSGSVSTGTLVSRELDRAWLYKVYLPDGYDKSDLYYPVIYLLHGSEGTEDDWDFAYPVFDDLISRNLIPPTIAVAAASGTSWWVNTATENIETAFLSDFIPAIDEKYRTIADRHGRGLAGFSMGGYGAMRYALVYPDSFGASTMLSAAIYDNLPPQGSSARSSGAFGVPFDPGLWSDRNYPAVLSTYSDTQSPVPIFIATGDDDFHHGEGFNFDVALQSVSLYGKLRRELGRPAELRIVNGGHSTEVWGRMLGQGLQYMFDFLSGPRQPVAIE